MTTLQSRNRASMTVAAQVILVVLPTLLSLVFVTSQAIGTESGVSDFTRVSPDVIQTGDIAEALAVPRGTRIQPAAPPTVRLPVYFEFDSADLMPEAEVLLSKVSAALVSDDLADFQFSVEGHTDGIGSEHYNARLSEERARAVKTFLMAKGVPGQHLATYGHGEGQPVASNASDEGRQRNRRVEVINLGAAR